MRTQKRNKQTLYFSQPAKSEELTDENGNYTGEYSEEHFLVESISMNVSPEKGVTVQTERGLVKKYERTLVTDDLNCPITEESKLWIGIPSNGSHNYVVSCISKSLNSVKITAERVIK